MIRLNRITSPTLQDFEAMLPHLILVVGDGTEFLQEVGVKMTQDPASVYLLQARNDENELVAFTIAQDPGILIPYVYIAQTWNSTSTKVADAMLARIYLWSVALGKRSIRGQTARNPDAIFRRFGFSTTGYIIEREIQASEIASLIAHSKEVING